MHIINQRFLRWCNLHGINPGQTFIGKGHLHLEPWAELRLKAYAGRAFTSFMAVCLQSLHGHVATDDDLALITVACGQISNWMLALEHAPLDLTDEMATSLYDDGMQLLSLTRNTFVPYIFVFSAI